MKQFKLIKERCEMKKSTPEANVDRSPLSARQSDLLPQEVTVVACSHQAMSFWPPSCIVEHEDGEPQVATYTRASDASKERRFSLDEINVVIGNRKLNSGLWSNREDDVVDVLRQRIALAFQCLVEGKDYRGTQAALISQHSPQNQESELQKAIAEHDQDMARLVRNTLHSPEVKIK